VTVINPVTDYIGDVDKMVSPDYSKIDLSPYVEHGFRVAKMARREVPIITSYGCIHNCLFCATRTISGKKIAYREVEDVIEEMRYMKQKYDVNAIMFLDDNILADEERAKKLFNRMIEEKFNFKFRLMSTAAWHLKEDILDLMVKAGCYSLTISIESGCNRVLHQIIRKPLKKEIVHGVIKMCQDRGIFVMANIVIGFPGETWKLGNLLHLAKSVILIICKFLWLHYYRRQIYIRWQKKKDAYHRILISLMKMNIQDFQEVILRQMNLLPKNWRFYVRMNGIE
jgi:radical SAM superfamily enzyme YgiQ (UPF0313 family)